MNLNDESTTEYLMKCRGDFTYFCKHVLGLEMTNYHREIADLPLRHRYLCIIIPTGHSKTTLFSIAYPLWRLWRERDIEICLVSSSTDQSMKILAKAQYVLETNPFFASLLPNNRLETWNKSQLITSNHNTYYIKPFNSTARGIHPNFIIYDDLLREYDTDMQVAKETFWSVFYPRGQIHNCQHIVVGTPIAPDDLYADIEKSKEWFFVRRSAIEDGKPLWPERFSMRDLSRIKASMSEYRFDREYMCKPRSAGDALYPAELVLNCLDDNLEYTYNHIGRTYIGCDFAMSTKSSGDYNVFTVVDECNEPYWLGNQIIENPVIVRRIVRFRGSIGQVESIKTLLNYYPNSKVIADSSNVGAKFVQELRASQIPVDAQDFRPANRNLLLLNLRRVMEGKSPGECGRLVIPNKGELVPLTNRLVKELTSFRSVKTKSGSESFQSSTDHDDMVMSLALAVKDITIQRKVMSDIFYGV